MIERVHTVVVGAGHSGLGTSYYLSEHGIEHVVLDRASRPGHVWNDERWDSFTMIVPNWGLRLPGGEYDGNECDGFMGRDDITRYFESYARRIKAPVRYNTTVSSIDQDAARKGYLVRTNDRSYLANNIVMATGYLQDPKPTPLSAEIPAWVKQIYVTQYRNPQSLPPGAVMVVGSGQSGAQITEELYQNGRTVYLAVGSAGRIPRRYRGKDSFQWTDISGFFDRTAEQLGITRARFAAPHLSGRDGGHDLNLHTFAHDGVVLTGHLVGVQGNRVQFAADLYESLAKADAFSDRFMQTIDDFISRSGIDAPINESQARRDGFAIPLLTELDLRSAGVNTIIWATGLRYDLAPLKVPVGDSEGFPVQDQGVTSYPGLYFAGLPFMPTLASGFMMRYAKQVAYIANHIAARPA